MAPGEPMPKTTDKMLAAFDAKGVMVSITLRYTRPGLSAPTYLVRPAQPSRAAGPHARLSLLSITLFGSKLACN